MEIKGIIVKKNLTLSNNYKQYPNHVETNPVNLSNYADEWILSQCVHFLKNISSYTEQVGSQLPNSFLKNRYTHSFPLVLCFGIRISYTPKCIRLVVLLVLPTTIPNIPGATVTLQLLLAHKSETSPLSQGSPNPWPQTGISPWPIRNQTTPQEVSGR